MGSSVLIVWPPTTSMPASFAFIAPPRRISASTSGARSWSGKPTIPSAEMGTPPMA